jgi:WD40 repeat protein
VEDGTVRLWDAVTGAERRPWQAEGVTVLAFSSDGKLLAGGDNDNTVRLWDAASGRERNPCAGHRCSVRYWVLSADGRRAASSGSDRTVRVWDANEGRELHRLAAPDGDMRPIALSTSAERLTTLGASIRQGGADNKARLSDVANGRETQAFALPVEDKLVFVSPDGRLCAVHDGKEIAFWDLTDGSKRTARIAVPAPVFDCRFTSDNRSLIGWTVDQIVCIWDVATGRERRRFSAGEKGDRPCIALSSEGRWLAFADNKGILSLYDVADGKEVRRIKGVPPFLSSLAFSPDGRTLGGGGMYDPTLYLWETATGLLRHRLRGHEGRIAALIFSADGTRLLSGSEDTTALIWDLTGASQRPPAHWDELASADAETAYQAVRVFAASASAVAFLRKQMQPIPTPDAETVARRIAALDADTFAQREQARKDLEKLGSAVEPALRAALANSPSTEKRRRVEALLAKMEAERLTLPATQVRIVRAVEVLERIGDREARHLLHDLAEGAPTAWQTQQAKAALDRLQRRR